MSEPFPRTRHVQLWLPIRDPPPITAGQYAYETWLVARRARGSI